jgi:hypothetical protein
MTRPLYSVRLAHTHIAYCRTHIVPLFMLARVAVQTNPKTTMRRR